MSESEYDSDGVEYHHTSWRAIKHFTIHDYLSCKETKNALNNFWYQKFYNKLEQPILSLYHSYLTPLKKIHSNVLHNANEYHAITLVDLIGHHIQKSYSLQVFKESPDLALPLLNQIAEINRVKKENLLATRKQKFHDVNKQYIWGNI
jgi:hypothetical protein